MRLTSYPARIMLFITSMGLLNAGCQKLRDYIGHQGNGTIDCCNIRSVISITSSGKRTDTLSFVFNYNSKGDPESIITNQVSTGNPNHFFVYDKYNRLRQMVRPYVNGSYETWDLYGYNSKNQIVYDTSYAFGLMVGTTPQVTNNLDYIKYEYDTQGRLVFERDSVISWGVYSFSYTRAYNYDAAGNLITGNGATYDNKLSINRTNSIWMFIAKDYSINNPFTATQYNANNLPLKFSGSLRLIPIGGSDVRAAYSCP